MIKILLVSQTNRNVGRENFQSINPKTFQTTISIRLRSDATFFSRNWSPDDVDHMLITCFVEKIKTTSLEHHPATGSTKSFAFRHAVFLRTENSPGTSRDKSKSTDEDGA